MNMNTQNYNNVVTFPEGKPYNITTGNALIFSLSNMNNELADMEDIFQQMLNSLENDMN